MAKQIKQLKKIERAAVRVTEGIGSTVSILIHTVLFVAIFALRLFGFGFADILLILTTAVSLEAIYLAIFIQMTINEQAADIDEIQEDIEEIQEDVEEIQEEGEEEEAKESADRKALDEIRTGLSKLMKDIEGLQKH